MFGILLRARDEFARESTACVDAFDRLALFIYGIRMPSQWSGLPPRRDGILRGADLLLTSAEVPATADDDSRRIALFASATSPYALDADGVVRPGDEPTGLRLAPFPYKKYAGPPLSYYLRSDRDNRYTRLVINPHGNCYARCKWCTRTYDSHARPERVQVPSDSDRALEPRAFRELPRAVLSVAEILALVTSDPAVMQGHADLGHLTELAILSGDFPPNVDAAAYLHELATSAWAAGFRGRLYYAGHQIETAEAMRALCRNGMTTFFVYTVEHFTRRQELMPVKGKRSIDDVEAILREATAVFPSEDIGYYLIIGIDPAKELRRGVTRLKPLATPQPFVLTPYNFVHERLYHDDYQIERMRLVLRARQMFLELYGKPMPGGSNRSLFPLNSV